MNNEYIDPAESVSSNEDYKEMIDAIGMARSESSAEDGTVLPDDPF